MTTHYIPTKSESIGLDDLQSEFLSLRVGEIIPRLEIKTIRKLTNPSKTDNLPGVDYKYFIENKHNQILSVNCWILWKLIAVALKQAGTIQATIELKHTDIKKYNVRVI